MGARRGSTWATARRASLTDRGITAPAYGSIRRIRTSCTSSASHALPDPTDGGNTFTIFKGSACAARTITTACGSIRPTQAAHAPRRRPGRDRNAADRRKDVEHLSTTKPIGQIYHVSTDTHYPYWVMGAEQDTGAIMTRSRGVELPDKINVYDASPLPASEFGTVTADPLHPEIASTAWDTAPDRARSGLIQNQHGDRSGLGTWRRTSGADSTKYRQVRDFWESYAAFRHCVRAQRDVCGLSVPARDPRRRGDVERVQPRPHDAEGPDNGGVRHAAAAATRHRRSAGDRQPCQCTSRGT